MLHLIDYFFKGIKDKKKLKIGVEHEKFVLNKNNFYQVSYEMQNGIKDISLVRGYKKEKSSRVRKRS